MLDNIKTAPDTVKRSFLAFEHGMMSLQSMAKLKDPTTHQSRPLGFGLKTYKISEKKAFSAAGWAS